MAYYYGAAIFGVLAFIIWLVIVASIILEKSIDFINDNDEKDRFAWRLNNFVEEFFEHEIVDYDENMYMFFMLLLCGSLFVLLSAALWPLAFPILFVVIFYYILVAIRKFKRFEKKIDEVLKKDAKEENKKSDN